MKKSLFAMQSVFSLLLLSSRVVSAQSTTNLLVNDGFEDRYQAPRGLDNIAPAYNSPTANTDLKVWYRPAYTIGGNQTSVSDTPDYIASDGATRVNPVTYYPSTYAVPGFSAHTGISCTQIHQASSTGLHDKDEFITQQLAQPLTPGHTYHASFWTLRAPGPPVSTKLALSITDSDPAFDHVNNTLVPSPGTKVIVSGNIQQRYVWTKIEGDITIPANQPNNKWLTIGYDRSDQIFDPTLQDDYPITELIFAIDDVSLVDIGPTCPSNLSLTAYVDGQQIAPASQPDQVSGAEVDIYTPVTFVVSGNNIGTSTWSVYTSAGPYSYTSVTNGNSFSITPSEPRSTTWPNGTTNGDQFYGITCTVTYPGCTSSTILEFALYSKPTGGPDPGFRSANSTVAYPNPAAESITLPLGAEGATLLNDKGKILRRTDSSGKLDVQSLPDGLYNLQMMQNGKLINQRIQVRH